MRDIRRGILIYFDSAAVFRMLSPEDCKTLLLAVLDYARTGEVPELSGQPAEVWPDFKAAADRDAESYENKSRGNRFGGYVTATKNAGCEPLSREQWEKAGEPSKHSLTQVEPGRAEVKQAIHTINQTDIHTINQTDNKEGNDAELCDSSALTPEQIFENKRRNAERLMMENGF